MAEQVAALRRILAAMPGALLAYSGGTDSTFLLRVASEVLGNRLVALTVRSPTSAAGEYADAKRMTAALGVTHVVVDADELAIPGYADNPADRCYLCKDNLFAICHAEAGHRAITAVIDGANCDDLGDYRPGLQAAAEQRVRHPLVEAGFTKADIRACSRKLGLPTWDKPASPCLSSRFPYGTKITVQRLRQIAAAETLLHQLGFRTCRVRYHEHIARLEVPVGDLARLLSEPTRVEVLTALRELGFVYVTLDLAGLRSGSLNQTLALAPPATGPTPGPPLS